LKISRKLRYGLRAMLFLAFYYQTGPVSARDVSKAESIPLDYLEQIFNKLKGAGLVKTTRGPRGGYALSRTPSAIKVKDIMDVLDVRTHITDCLDNHARHGCDRSESCAAILFWRRLNESIQDIAASTSLQDLLKKGPKHPGISHSYVFQI
jgi:Rrf2 family transcriptional regulator, cysteine metabolism repressor